MDPEEQPAVAGPSALRRILSEILAINRADSSPSSLSAPAGSSELGDAGSAHGSRSSDSAPRTSELADALRDAGFAPAPFDESEIPERFGRYIVLGTLGRGGMGLVLEAFDRSLDRKVAVKLLHRHLARKHTQRLIREAKALARLSHPNVVQVHEVGEVEDQTFVAMELVSGQTLQRWQSRARPWKECVQVYLQAGRGLAAAHAKDLVHRDFKPGNCILDDEGRVRVLDFGLVRELDAEEIEVELGGPAERPGSSDDERQEPVNPVEQAEQAEPVEPAEPVEQAEPVDELTRTGTVLGTLAYMAPEQLRGEPVDARADQFSFCVSLYEALYGRRPFAGETVGALIDALEEGRLRPLPRRSGVPSRLQAAVLRGLARDPDQRWPTMEELLGALERVVRSTWRWWTGGLLLVGAVAVGGAAMWQEIQVCAGSEELVADVWNEERKEQVEAAVLGTDLSYAAGTWQRVEQGLDDYARGWVDKHEEVCRATKERKEQSSQVMELRMECLLRRRIELREAVGVLAEANEARVQKAVELVAGLPGLSRCDDIESLLARLPPPEDAHVAREVETLRERLEQARWLRKTGEYAESFTVADQVVARAESLGYAPLLAEAMLQRGSTHTREAQYDEAERDLKRAYVLAAQLGHHTVEAEAVASLTVVVGEGQARPEQGLQWGVTALALARGPHVEPRVEGNALSNIGNVLRRQGKLEQALDHQRRALTIREEALGVGHPSVAGSLGNIGLVLYDQGKLEEALTHHERALTIKEDALGAGHPSVAGSLGNIGLVLYDQGKLEESLAHHERALAIYEQALGAGHPHVASSLNNIGNVLEEQGKLDEALEHQRRALAIYEAALGARHASVAASLNNIGNVLEAQGKLDEALGHQQRALAIRTEVWGAGHPNVAASLNNIGVVLEEQGRLDEARTHFERALATFENALGAEHPSVAYPVLELAKVALTQGDPTAALPHAERAVAIVSSGEVSPERLAEARFVLARALWADPARRPHALELARQAAGAYAELDSADTGPLGEIEAWLDEHVAEGG